MRLWRVFVPAAASVLAIQALLGSPHSLAEGAGHAGRPSAGQPRATDRVIVGPEVPVGTTVRQPSLRGYYPSAAFAQGVYMAVWSDRGHASTMAARMSSDGTLLDRTRRVLDEPAYSPKVASNGHMFLVVMNEGSWGQFGPTVGMRILPDGTLLDRKPFVISDWSVRGVASTGSDFAVTVSRAGSGLYDYGDMGMVQVAADGNVLDPSPISVRPRIGRRTAAPSRGTAVDT
jgi:hypothetical protein